MADPMYIVTQMAHEAHLDRAFAKTLSQVELLRIRLGEQLPPPVRLEFNME